MLILNGMKINIRKVGFKMKDVVEIRIDDRLIHGQVVGLWTNTLNATRIMVIDDEVSADQAQKQLLRMVAPSTVKTSIISEDKAFNNLKDNRYQGQRGGREFLDSSESYWNGITSCYSITCN